MAKTEEKAEKLSISELVVEGIQKNRKMLFTGGIVSIILLIGVVAGLSIRDRVTAQGIKKVEAYTDRYEELRFDINDPSKEEDVKTLLDEISAYAAGAFGYSGTRSFMLAASIHADRKNWQEAENAWVQAAQKGGKSYLVPVALFNAAVAAEENGNLDGAIAHYTEALSYADSFPLAAKAQFAIGRLWEERQDTVTALEAYRTLIEKWPGETIWINLANSRIIALSGLNS
ncbi:MAG: tetratricopeptide repeat protein [Spirochaetaceae bacterium]|jgi:tetratricopeptide (TPR) repeat protein|nr:tetratricopeptide repeat protein [Spirochaetaceae bacterium]